MNIQRSYLRFVVGAIPVMVTLAVGCGKQSPESKVTKLEIPSQETSAPRPTAGNKHTDEPRGDVSKLKPDFFLSSTQFAEEMTRDKVAGMKKYEGKVLELKGSIARVGTTHSYGPVLYLEGNKGDKTNLVGFVLSESKPWSKYVLGQQLTIRGKVTNNVLILVPCEVVESTRSITEALTAPQLDEECNKPSGDEKYREKFLLVTGTIVAKKNNETYNAQCLELKGGPDRNVECLFITKDESLDSLKKGQQVKVQGTIFDTGATVIRLIDCFLIEPGK